MRILAVSMAAALFALAAAGCGAAEVSPTSATATVTNAPAPTAAAAATASARAAADVSSMSATAIATNAPAPTAAATATATTSASARASSQTPSDDGDVRTLATEDDELEIVTLLGFDAIRAILEPEFVDAAQADEWLDDDVPVIGVSINGDSRAYTVPMLSVHEIVNDVVGGEPVAVTW